MGKLNFLKLIIINSQKKINVFISLLLRVSYPWPAEDKIPLQIVLVLKFDFLISIELKNLWKIKSFIQKIIHKIKLLGLTFF